MYIGLHMVKDRYLCILMSYVRNKTYPKGSIVEGYIIDKCTTFCFRYLNDMETKYNRNDKKLVGLNTTRDEGLIIFKCIGLALGKPTLCELSSKEWSQAHLYVLTNCEDVIPFIE